MVATQTSFSRPTLYRWCASGRLPVVRVGRSLRIRESDVRAMIEGGLDAESRGIEAATR